MQKIPFESLDSDFLDHNNKNDSLHCSSDTNTGFFAQLRQHLAKDSQDASGTKLSGFSDFMAPNITQVAKHDFDAQLTDEELTSQRLSDLCSEHFKAVGLDKSRPARGVEGLFRLVTDADRLNLDELKKIEFDLQATLSMIQKLKNKRLS